jgi:pimeloyl-ACP methyl ester carboxylesterase
MPPRRRILPSAARPAPLAAAAAAAADYGRSDRPNWRSVPWRAHLRAVTVAGRRVHLVELGGGAATPLLLVHGLGGRWQNWIETIPRAAASRRVVALDLPGFGRSQLPLEPISLEGYARTLARVCDLLELERVVLAGSSMGGAVAVRLALAEPELVERLMLVSPAALRGGSDFEPAFAAAALTALGHTPLGRPDGIRPLLRRRRLRHYALSALVRHPTLIARDTLFEMVGGRGAPALAAAFEAMFDGDGIATAELGALTQPVLIVHGRDDVLVAAEESAWLRRQIPRARLELFEDTGHLPMIERPVRFNDLLARFAADGA